jgi:hypothetical protein
MAIWNILWIFGILYDYWVQFWYHAPRKIWQPCSKLSKSRQVSHQINPSPINSHSVINWMHLWPCLHFRYRFLREKNDFSNTNFMKKARPVFYNMVRPQEWSLPLGVKLAPSGELCPLEGMFTPSFTPRGEHSKLFRRMEGRTEKFTPTG